MSDHRVDYIRVVLRVLLHDRNMQLAVERVLYAEATKARALIKSRNEGVTLAKGDVSRWKVAKENTPLWRIYYSFVLWPQKLYFCERTPPLPYFFQRSCYLVILNSAQQCWKYIINIVSVASKVDISTKSATVMCMNIGMKYFSSSKTIAAKPKSSHGRDSFNGATTSSTFGKICVIRKVTMLA